MEFRLPLLSTTAGWLHQFAPINKVDALSQLTSFRRYDRGSPELKHLPAWYRQNHPSFRD